MDIAPVTQRIRLFLIDDHVLFRESLSRLLASEPDFDVTGQCGRSTEAVAALKESSVDVVLLACGTDHEGRDDFIARTRDTGYAGKILLITADMDEMEALRALQIGVAGIFFQHNSASSLAQAIRLVAAGDVWLDRRVIQLLADRVPHREGRNFEESLTVREKQVLGRLTDGHTNRKIADGLGMSEGTVKATLQKLFRKFNVRTRSQLVRIAVAGQAGIRSDET
jgi:DNA-binding NarL/FixJ family response regulator